MVDPILKPNKLAIFVEMTSNFYSSCKNVLSLCVERLAFLSFLVKKCHSLRKKRRSAC